MTDRIFEPAAAAAATRERAPALFLAAVAAVLIGRIALLVVTPLGLHPDEAQYWYWSRSLDWGYFSKPPLVAWAIALTTGVAGDAPWGVRLAAPIAHSLAALALWRLGRDLYGPKAGLLAGLAWLLMPGIWLSSLVITTDALLLPIWSAALLTTWRWIQTRAWRWALATGALIGLGLLAKYAMLYFMLGAALAALWGPEARRALLSRQGAAAAGVALALIAPNLLWNAAHDFETVGHTAANANWSGALFRPDQLGAFLVDQFGIAGGLLAGLALALYRIGRGKEAFDARARFLAAFLLPPLAVILTQALISRAHGNWAAAAYPAAIVLVAGMLPRLTAIATAGHAALYLAFAALISSTSLVDSWKLDNAIKRQRDWDVTAAAVERQARAGGPYTAVITDYRHAFFELAYHWRDKPGLPPLRMWPLLDAPGNHAESVAPVRAGVDDGRALAMLMLTRYEDEFAADFTVFRVLERRVQPLGPRKTRPYALVEVSVYQRAPRTEAFVATMGDE